MNYRAKLIKAVTFIGGLYFFLKFVLPKQITIAQFSGEPIVIEFGKYHEQISLGITALIVMSVGLGIGNLIYRNASTIAYRRPGALNSLALLGGLFAMIGLSAFQWRESLEASAKAERFFMLKDFGERINSDAFNETKIIVPEGTEFPSINERTVALKKAVTTEIENTRDELSKDSALDEGLTKKVVEELEASLVTLEAGNSRLVISQEAEAPIDFSLHLELAKSLSEAGAKRSEVLTLVGKRTTTKKAYDFLFSGIFVALGSAMFSLLGFYIASAAFRAFRIRSYESALMMGAALLVILGQIPFMVFGDNAFGNWVHETIPGVRMWLLTIPNSAAFRAIEIGAAVASLIMGFRMWLSIESEGFSSPLQKKGAPK